MESPLGLTTVHWDHEPKMRNLFISKRGILRFMESPHDFDAVHWDHEPFRGTPLVWSPAFKRLQAVRTG
jgi:hypothetical protein